MCSDERVSAVKQRVTHHATPVRCPNVYIALAHERSTLTTRNENWASHI
jgi:hypothetical protein